MRQTDLHMLGPWLAGGAGALGLLGYGTGTAGASILVASGATGGAAAAGGGLGWAGLPVAIKGLAVAAVVATTGTAAVELPKTARDGSTARSSARAAGHAPAISPLHDQVREQALAQAATARRERRARATREAAAGRRVRTSDGGGEAAKLAGPGRGSQVAPITPVPAAHAAPQPSPTAPATTREPATVARTPEQIAAEDLQRVRDRIADAFRDAQAMAAPGTQSALAAANSLIQSTLGSISPLLDDILATVGLKLPSPTTTQPPVTSVTNVLAPVQSLLAGVDDMLQSLFGRR